nr:TonB-dependent receptor [Sphingobium subterraneum]
MHGFLVSSALTVQPAIAQSAPGSDADRTVLEDIVVTAQKRSQNLQDVPVAVSAVSSAMLESANVTNATDISRLVPSISFFNTSGAVQPFLRGVGSPISLVGAENSVATYIDGVYMVRVHPALLELTNIERVEVLKGPQGTLFGRNASGGLVHIVTRTPTGEPSGKFSVGYGNYDTLRASAYASLGLAEGLALDVAGVTLYQRDGWGTNRFTGEDWGKQNTKAVRGKLHWQGDGTSLDLTADYSSTHHDFLAHSQYLPGGVRRGYDLPPYGLQPILPFYDISTNDRPLAKEKAWGLSGKLMQELPFAQFSSITAYRKDDSLIVFDADFSEQDNLAADLFGKVKQFSQEFQLASLSSSKVQWILGLYYLNWKAGYDPGRFRGGSFGGLYFDGVGITQNKSYAAYAQATVPLGVDTNVTVGARYTHDKISGRGSSTLYVPGGPVILPVTPTPSASETFKKFTYKVSLDHNFSRDLMVYASQSRGYKAGLYNTLPYAPLAAKPEVVDASEIGFKSQVADRRVRLNGAAFFYNFKNAQFQQFNGPTVIYVNAPKSEIYGAEMEGQALVANNLELRFGATYLHSKYKSFPNAQTPTPNTNTNPLVGPVGGYGPALVPFDASGNRMIRVPDWTLSLGLNYTLKTGAGDFNFDMNWAYNDGFAWDADNVSHQKAYSLVDAQVKYGLSGPLDGAAIKFWVKNLTKEKYYAAQVQSSGARGTSAMPGAPRTYGVDLSFSF